MKKIISKIAGTLLGFSLALGVGFTIANDRKGSAPVFAAEEVFYTLTPAAGSNSDYSKNGDVQIDGITWNVSGNNSMVPWRIGGKSLSGVDRTVYSKTAMNSTITKVELTVGAASSITVNSLNLTVASDAGFANVISTVSQTFSANSTMTFSHPSADSAWTNAYYKFTFNVSVTGTSNKFVAFSSAEFYYEAAAPATPTITVDDNLNVYKDQIKTLSVSYASLKANISATQLSSDGGAVTLSLSESGTYTSSLTLNYTLTSPQTVYVKGVSNGTISLSFASTDATTKTCTVTVSDAPSEVVITKGIVDGISTSYAEHDWTYGSGTDAISGKYQGAYNGDDLQLNKKQGSWAYNTDAIKGYITGVTCTKVSGTTDLSCWAGTSVISADPSSGGNPNQTYSWTFDPNDHYTYFRISATGSEGARKVSSITITYQKVAEVDPTGISLDNSSDVNMDRYGYGRRRLVATVEPFNANNKTVTWGTSDNSVVTVDNGVLTAVGVGNATVYATTSNFVSDVATPDLKASVAVHVSEALYKKATFVPTSVTTAEQHDDYLPSGSVSLNATSAGSWNTEKSAIQLSGGKDVTFTISGYTGMKISGIDLIMSSNAAAGTGSLTVTAGSTDILSIATAPFDDSSWNGAYSGNACDLYKATTEYVVGSGETIKFAFSSTVNSLYVHSVAVRYLDYSLEQWCGNFLSQITCDGGDPGAITDDSSWNDLGVDFAALDEDLRDLAANATADKTSASVIEQAMARYDLIIRKYGTNTSAGGHTDFIGRFGVGTVNGPLGVTQYSLQNTNSNASTIIIVVVALTSITSIGVLLVIKRKRSLVK